ncbi:MAG: aconitate hydratase AcnA [Betaproteobacteria bacterium]|nr:MAG: aconitate hydratase AcnA [Betaproteobacteria bacterium]TMH76809.1 MAG: aconitate hydratase AcnA [Betaproteobacteria bacterium]
MSHNLFNTLQEFKMASGKTGKFYSLPALEKALGAKVSRLPVSIRIVLESVLRHCDGKKITEEHVRQLANWKPNAPRTDEIPFVLSRILLQDLTGIPSLADLAAMRSVAQRLGKNPKVVEPLVPVDLVVDHSIQIDHYGVKNALDLNMKLEFKRNQERYTFMKWATQAFDTFRVVPPGIGIVHQVNLEYLARGVHKKDGLYYPDTLVGTDSHTTMVNGIGVVAWGVGGIEAEAGMLGQPTYILTPDVVGFHLKGKLRGGVTATDLVLTVTEILRKAKVVNKFVEFFGEGTESLTVPDRATIGNMAPDYGATMGFFPIDDATIDYFEGTGRTKDEIDAFQSYFKAQGMYGTPKKGDIDYSDVIELDLGTVTPSLAGPKRPQDRIEIGKVKAKFTELFAKPAAENGFSKKPEDLGRRFKTRDGLDVGSGDVMIAAITSCTNTSNPGVLLAAGLLAKKAVERGLTVKKHVKTSLAPGSRVVTEYLKKTGLLPYLEKLGFSLAAYGCTTCIGNSGPLAETIDEAISKNDLVGAAVLSGNRNFEARIHASLRANFLASPPLVVAYALSGTVLKDLMSEPIGKGKNGEDVWIGDIWPSAQEIQALMKYAMDPKTFRTLYGDVANANPMWKSVPAPSGQVYNWPKSTYIAEPPFFRDFSMQPRPTGSIRGARVLGIFGDSLTTDHISPAGSIKPTSPAGTYLLEHDVAVPDFNSFGARRGNHEVMMRGTFGNVRIKNLMLPTKADGSRTEGGLTYHQPSGEQMPIYEAAMKYIAAGVPTVVFGGEEYGTGSSRDWAAKGTLLLGTRAVIVKSFERIHRANLVMMGVLPFQFMGNDSVASLDIKGDETIDILGIEGGVHPRQEVPLVIRRKDGTTESIKVLLRIETPIEVDYYVHGGILPFVLRELLSTAKSSARAA